MTLRAHLIQVVFDAIMRAAVWLLRAEELPPIDRTTLDVPLRSRPLTLRRCNEFQLLVLFHADGTLAYALGTSPEPGHRVDTRWLQ